MSVYEQEQTQHKKHYHCLSFQCWIETIDLSALLNWVYGLIGALAVILQLLPFKRLKKLFELCRN